MYMEEMHLQENSLPDLLSRPWGQGHANSFQYPLQYVTYSPAKFEAATSNGLGGNTFTRTYIIFF